MRAKITDEANSLMCFNFDSLQYPTYPLTGSRSRQPVKRLRVCPDGERKCTLVLVTVNELRQPLEDIKELGNVFKQNHKEVLNSGVIYYLLILLNHKI